MTKTPWLFVVRVFFYMKNVSYSSVFCKTCFSIAVSTAVCAVGFFLYYHILSDRIQKESCEKQSVKFFS